MKKQNWYANATLEERKKIIVNNIRNQRKRSLSGFRNFWDSLEEPQEMSDINRLMDWEIFNGLMLSDASINKNKFNSRFNISQVSVHRELIDVTYLMLRNAGIQSNVYQRLVKPFKSKKYNRICVSREQTVLETQRSKIFTELRKKWYPNNKKTVPDDIEITPKTLAWWLMGDGGSSYMIKGNSKLVHAQLCTNCFSELENMKLIKKLNNLNIEGFFYSGSQQKYLHLKQTTEVIKFMKIIEPFILDCFKYKIKYPTLTKYGITYAKTRMKKKENGVNKTNAR